MLTRGSNELNAKPRLKSILFQQSQQRIMEKSRQFSFLAKKRFYNYGFAVCLCNLSTIQITPTECAPLNVFVYCKPFLL
ncbi:hypothetical protein SPOG_05566 [Schizosaccharomyces cryophilus OY26]|uniref:Uncharacterized protein n=1 Tax=Schizosaccharomyces cryophilus (strain OY26 / ATCC MYA-4695 / CBS 11777 / NBRC 106824 / NRRL Y48691) TaxID=653667 RepID=S9XAS4_SCHCR|nr:uncharacterized protein SPOG_05566 [Schizosaccharomyces cryophilus OY26]EPY54257.1 hypothetical protein SPOG_05566 [Schizosaccharomyces cryophilus OY26]